MPLAERPAVAVAALVYLAFVVAIGLWSHRRTRSAKDFFIAGQRLGVVTTGFAAMASAFSGFVFLGGPGLTYRLGAAAFWINVPIGFTAVLLCWAGGKRLRLLSEVRSVYTLPDALAARWEAPGRERSPFAAPATWAALAIVVATVGYLGAQLQALGILVEEVFEPAALLGLPAAVAADLALALGVAVVVAYSVAGGMVAGVYTDLFQGVLMVGAAVAVFARALEVGGGLGGIADSISGSAGFGPAFLDPLGTVPAATALSFFFVFGVGVLGQPQMLHKFFMLRDPRRLRYLPAVLGGSQILTLLVWLGIGLAVPALVARGEMAPLADPDQAAPRFLLEQAPELLAGIVLAGVLAAVMSTADTFLNLGAAAIVRDLPRAFGGRGRRGRRRAAGAGDGSGAVAGSAPAGLEERERTELRRARVVTVLLAVAAALFARLYDDLVALLGTFAFGTFAAALAPVVAVGLHWRRVPAAAAAASIGVGAGANLVLELLGRQTLFPALPDPPLAPGVLPTAFSLALSFATLFAVTWWTTRDGRREVLAPDVAAVMES